MTDIAVIGSGVKGLYSAWELAKAGNSRTSAVAVSIPNNVGLEELIANDREH